MAPWGPPEVLEKLQASQFASASTVVRTVVRLLEPSSHLRMCLLLDAASHESSGGHLSPIFCFSNRIGKF